MKIVLVLLFLITLFSLVFSANPDCTPQDECIIDTDCEFNKFCVGCNCESARNNIINLTTQFDKNLDVTLKCTFDTTAIIEIYSPQNELIIQEDSFCNQIPYTKIINFLEIKSGIHKIVAQIPQSCSICQREALVMINSQDKDSSTNIPDNNLITILIMLIFVLFFTSKNKNKIIKSKDL